MMIIHFMHRNAPLFETPGRTEKKIYIYIKGQGPLEWWRSILIANSRYFNEGGELRFTSQESFLTRAMALRRRVSRIVTAATPLWDVYDKICRTFRPWQPTDLPLVARI